MTIHFKFKKIHKVAIPVFIVDDFSKFRNPFILIFEKFVDVLIVLHFCPEHISFRLSPKCVNY